MEAVKLPQLYQILVLPQYYDKVTKKWLLSVALPFFVSSSDDQIERFMLSSKDVVDRRARYAGLYRLGRAQGMNLTTGKVREVTGKDFGEEELAN